MTEVFAGNVKIEVRLTLENLEVKPFHSRRKMKEFHLILESGFSVVKIDELERYFGSQKRTVKTSRAISSLNYHNFEKTS